LSTLKERGFAVLPKARKSPMVCGSVRSTVNIGDFLIKFMHHMPHFCEAMFNLVSIMNWQGLLLERPCVGSFVVNASVRTFWKKDVFEPDSDWMRELVNVVDGHYLTKSITSTTSHCSLLRGNASAPPAPGTLHGWFLHPTDAVALTAAVLGEDPCASLPAAFTKGDNLQVLLVDRTVGRRLARPDVVKDYLSQKPYVSSVFLVTFRGGVGTLISQARQAHAANVFIATHGAGNTNIAFMRPCSIFIELYPRLFYLPQYFGSLARQAGLLHFPIQVGTNQSHGYASDRCITTMSKVTSNSDCFNDVACRRCARGVDSIDVSLDDIGAALEKGLIERTKCIKSSLYYSEIIVTTSR